MQFSQIPRQSVALFLIDRIHGYIILRRNNCSLEFLPFLDRSSWLIGTRSLLGFPVWCACLLHSLRNVSATLDDFLNGNNPSHVKHSSTDQSINQSVYLSIYDQLVFILKVWRMTGDLYFTADQVDFYPIQSSSIHLDSSRLSMLVFTFFWCPFFAVWRDLVLRLSAQPEPFPFLRPVRRVLSTLFVLFPPSGLSVLLTWTFFLRRTLENAGDDGHPTLSDALPGTPHVPLRSDQHGRARKLEMEFQVRQINQFSLYHQMILLFNG